MKNIWLEQKNYFKTEKDFYIEITRDEEGYANPNTGEFGEALYDYSEGWDAKNQLENFLNEKISGDTYSKLMGRIIESIKKDEIHLEIDTSGMEIDENHIANDVKVVINGKDGKSYDYYLDNIQLPDHKTFPDPEPYFEVRDNILLKNAYDCIEEIFDYHGFRKTDLMEFLDESYIDYDDIIQIGYFNDAYNQSGQYVMFIENTDYPSYEAFNECAGAVFEDFDAILDGEYYWAVVYDSKGKEVCDITDVEDKLLQTLKEKYGDIAERLDDEPDFEEINALKITEDTIDAVNKFIEDNDLFGQVDYLWTVNDVKDQIHTELENGEYGFAGKLCQMVEELENSPYEYVYADFNSGFRPIGHIDELFEYFETDLEGLDIEKPEQNTPSYNEEER